MYIKNMGSIDIEEWRDFKDAVSLPSLQVFEDQNLKNRPIGFIWNNQPKVITKWN